MRLGITVALGCVAALISIVAVNGQDFANVSDSSVTSGKYKPLTLWDSISLGASYYTNPQRAKTTSIAYSFDGPEFSSGSKSQALWDFARQGKISFGLTDKDKKQITVVPLSELQKRFTVEGPADLMNVLTKDDVLVVVPDKTLLGEASKTLIVKTEAPKE